MTWWMILAVILAALAGGGVVYLWIMIKAGKAMQR